MRLPRNNSPLAFLTWDVSSISLDDIPTAPCQDQVSMLANSPFYSPVRSSASPSLSPITSFSTFHPVTQAPPQLRTSPEGSSASDQDIERTSAQGEISDIHMEHTRSVTLITTNNRLTVIVCTLVVCVCSVCSMFRNPNVSEYNHFS